MIAALNSRTAEPISHRHVVAHISVVVPVYSGAAFLKDLARELDTVRSKWRDVGSPLALTEVIFVDDESVDESFELLLELQEQHDWVRVLQLSRNYGQHPATVAGILHTCGDWVCTLDEDLQHPPQYLVPLLQQAISMSCDVVYAQPEEAVHESPFRDLGSRLFKSILSRLSGNPQTRKFNSFRVIRGSVARAAAAVSSPETYFDVALCWFTNRITCHRLPMKDRRYIDRRRSGYSLRGLLRHARRMLVTSELKVLRLGAVVGFMALLGSIVTAGLVLACKLFFPETVQVQGWTSLTLIVVFFGGLTSLLLGIALEYTLIILMRTQGQPTYLVIDRSQDLLLKNWLEQEART